MSDKFPFILNGHPYEWDRPYITAYELKNIGHIPTEDDIFLKVQGPDEVITADNPVDLSRFGVHELYSKKPEIFKFLLNGTLFDWKEPFVTGSELRRIGHIDEDHVIYLRVEGPDEEIAADRRVDLRPFGTEEFYSKKRPPVLVEIMVDDKPYKITAGQHSVAEIKKVGGVNPSYDLEEVIDGVLTPLPDDGTVVIKGGEVFFSHPKGGSSS
jgi:Multiubiquitin